MYVVLVYDFGEKRVAKMLKLCRKYLNWIQNSVFECILTESQFFVLRDQLKGIIDTEQDSIRFNNLGKNWKRKVETLGKDMGLDLTGELII